MIEQASCPRVNNMHELTVTTTNQMPAARYALTSVALLECLPLHDAGGAEEPMDELEAEMLLGLKPKPGTLVPVKSGKVRPRLPDIANCNSRPDLTHSCSPSNRFGSLSRR